MNAQIKKGILETYILYIVKINDSIYGYDLIKKMKKYFPEVNESTFYSILRRTNKKNLTKITLSNISGGTTRKYYKLTEEGEIHLKNSIEELKELVNIINILIN